MGSTEYSKKRIVGNETGKEQKKKPDHTSHYSRYYNKET
jgi:hypothetical protein